VNKHTFEIRMILRIYRPWKCHSWTYVNRFL